MKKLLLVFVVALSLIMLTGCMNEDDYYNKGEVDQMIEDLQPSDMERYFYSLLESAFLDGSIQFAEVGDTLTGEVEGYSYGYIVIELDTALAVVIETTVVAPFQGWNLNIYYDGQIDIPDLEFDDIENGDKFTVTLREGFNTIELDSYTSTDYLFTIKIYEPSQKA